MKQILNCVENAHRNLVDRIDFLTLEEASDLLKVSKSFLYKLTSSKQIPHFKPSGKLIYFQKSDLEKWILEGRISTTRESTENLFNNLKLRKNESKFF